MSAMVDKQEIITQLQQKGFTTYKNINDVFVKDVIIRLRQPLGFEQSSGKASIISLIVDLRSSERFACWADLEHNAWLENNSVPDDIITLLSKE